MIFYFTFIIAIKVSIQFNVEYSTYLSDKIPKIQNSKKLRQHNFKKSYNIASEDELQL